MICVVGVVAILFFGARVATVLIIALLIACCGGMMFGMGRMSGKNSPKSRQSNDRSEHTAPVDTKSLRENKPQETERKGKS